MSSTEARVGVAGVVHHDVQPPEGRHGAGHGAAGGLGVGDVQRDRGDGVAVARHEIVQTAGSRAVAATRSPASSAATAIARPRPRDEPVTRKVLDMSAAPLTNWMVD